MNIYIKMDLALNNLQRLICHKNQPTNQLKVNVLDRLVFGLVYCNVAVHHVSYYATGDFFRLTGISGCEKTLISEDLSLSVLSQQQYLHVNLKKNPPVHFRYWILINDWQSNVTTTPPFSLIIYLSSSSSAASLFISLSRSSSRHPVSVQS